MTVASTLNKKQYQGNNFTTEFPLPFHVTAKEHIFALLKKGTKISEIKNNFAVDLERKVFIYPVQGEAIANDESLTIYRKIPLTQIVDLENAGAFHPEVLEYDGFDRIVMQIQQLDEEISRALKIDITDTRDVDNLIEELFKAREEAVLSAQYALEQAERAADKAEKTENWALFAEDKVKELTELDVACFVSNDGQGQVTYDKDKHKLEIVLPFDNAGSNQAKVVLTDSTDLARSDIGASAKAVQSLQAKINQNMTAALAAKLDKSARSNATDSESEETVATSKAISDLRKQMSEFGPPSNKHIDINFTFTASDSDVRDHYTNFFVAPANGYVSVDYGIELDENIMTYCNAYTYGSEHDESIENFGKDFIIRLNNNPAGAHKARIVGYIPIRKGDKFALQYWGNTIRITHAQFIYAEGELPK